MRCVGDEAPHTLKREVDAREKFVEGVGERCQFGRSVADLEAPVELRAADPACLGRPRLQRGKMQCSEQVSADEREQQEYGETGGDGAADDAKIGVNGIEPSEGGDREFAAAVGSGGARSRPRAEGLLRAGRGRGPQDPMIAAWFIIIKP